MEILKDLVERLTSRTFIVLVISIVLFVTGHITADGFLTINGVSFGGTSLKDIVAKMPDKSVK